MREAQFLRLNSDRWKQCEQELNHPGNPDALADRFVELTDDLAYARTFYPSSNSTKYLNGLVGLFHQKIYRNKKEKASRILSFWQFELPYLFKQYHRQLLVSFLFFLAFCLIGALSAKYDNSFLRLVVGDKYVDTTNENIEKGDPFGVYKQSNELVMFLGIASNNIAISFYLFATGIFFSVGTLYFMLTNGIMLGSFLQYFFARGLGRQAVMAVFIHGTIEICVLVVAGCSGLILGNSLLFPKTYSRMESLKREGKNAMKIVFGLIPFFIIAAFLEGFVTRHYQGIPTWLNFLVLGVSLFLILWYFIFYPIRLHRRIETAGNLLPGEQYNFQVWLTKKLSSEK
jgi:uncharacterized membrane protein SpoIIM required for sporulation